MKKKKARIDGMLPSEKSASQAAMLKFYKHVVNGFGYEYTIKEQG